MRLRSNMVGGDGSCWICGINASTVCVMPSWLAPFALPLFAVVAVVLIVTLHLVGVLILAAGIVVLRVRHLKSHPPDPELASEPSSGFQKARTWFSSGKF
jgi:hypothetical protein